MAVDLRDQHPLLRVQGDLLVAVIAPQQLRNVIDRGDLLRQHAPLVEAAGRFHQQIRVRLGDGLAVGLLAGAELELAGVPDRQRVDGLFADQVGDESVHHLPVFQVDESALVLPRKSELTRFPGDADQLNDVG